MHKLFTGTVLALGAVSATAAQAATCDRSCLVQLGNAYLAALAKHQPNSVPLAGKVLFVENAKRLKVGEGLWQTASAGPTAFSIMVPDAQQQTLGWMGVMQRDNKPVMVAIRLKLDDGKISEAEHLVSDLRPDNMK